jgi:hypothetical protein
VQEVKLAEVLAHGLHSFDERDLPMEPEELHVSMTGVEDECTTEGEEL